MYLDPSWRILTIGDGDLSFSKSLAIHHRPRLLEASFYDDEATLLAKYAENELHALRELGIPVHTGLDITHASSVKHIGKKFDLVIFQFPLIPAFTSREDFERQNVASTNTLNRLLLRTFLRHSFEYLLDERGEQLCYISSKDVKPYREWNLEGSLNQGLEIPYLGSIPFDHNKFPGYRIRHVDRDDIVAETKGTTYVWGHAAGSELTRHLIFPSYLEPGYCAMCRAGPFLGAEDRDKHLGSKQHLRIQALENHWIEKLHDEPDGRDES